MIAAVHLDRAVLRALRRLPRHVADKLLGWVAAVETFGLETVRKTPGYHDEPLKGQRAGQRSIRLSRAYRAIYTVEQKAVRIEHVRVIEVHKHDY
jgi:toxin HigB-1